MLYHQPLNEHRAGQETSSRRSARPAMERTDSLRKTHEGEGVIQAKTMIRYSPGRYDYDFDPREGKFRKSVTVGREMHAELDPEDERNGSSTKQGGDVHVDLMQYLNRKWGTPMVRGHLLNDHLGGLAVEENLFPISRKANTQHQQKFEKFVKYFVYDRSKNGPGLVRYDVTVNNEDGSQRFDEFHPRTEFKCHLVVYGREEADSAREDRVIMPETICTVSSDISDGSSGNGESDPFGRKTPYSYNICGRWNPVNTILKDRSHTVTAEGGYELRRQDSQDDLGEQGNLGTVTYESGSYI